MNIDYLIVGNGICGALLSRELINQGAKVVVIDASNGHSSTKVAGGIINPVTGKRMVTSWMTEELMPFAGSLYKSMEAELEVSLVADIDLLDFFPTADSRDQFHARVAQGNKYLHIINDSTEWLQDFRFNYGIGCIAPCLLLDTNALLCSWTNRLKRLDSYIDAEFNSVELVVLDNGIEYRDIKAKKVIFCEGATGETNTWFERLPWARDKGEVLIAAIPGLSRKHIYKQGISIVPWKDNLFWIGATHDWKFANLQPTVAFEQQVKNQLNYWLKLPYIITDHLVAQRPATVDRKPFVGMHPQFNSIGIFNGMGGKGFSLAPYFAHHFCRHLLFGEPLMPDININRYTRVLTTY